MTARKTALITGASMGLGADYARICARDGMNVILVARSKDKLDALAAEVSQKHGVLAHAVPVDLDARDAASHVKAAVDALGLPVDVLINNAGFGNTGAFVENELGKELSMIHVNIEALTALTHIYANEMLKRGGGRIMLVASTAGYQPAPAMAVYCATKAYVVSFGAALAYEMAGSGVTITTHCPGATETEFARTAGNADSRIFQNKAIVATSASCAEDGFSAMQRGKGEAVHGFTNWVSIVGAKLLPRWIILRIAAFLLGWKGLTSRRA